MSVSFNSCNRKVGRSCVDGIHCSRKKLISSKGFLLSSQLKTINQVTTLLLVKTYWSSFMMAKKNEPVIYDGDSYLRSEERRVGKECRSQGWRIARIER